MSVDRVVVEADGGSRGNPGPAGYGAVVLDPVTGEVLAERLDSLGVQTNNVAEYRGLIAGLTAALELGARQVAVRMDSKLVVEQMSGRWQVKHPALRPLAQQAAALRGRFEQVSFEWIPRERNKRADRLANDAMDRAAGRPPRAARPSAGGGQPDRPVRQAGAAQSEQSPVPSWVPPTTTPTRLLLARHGATEHSPAKRFSGRNDLPLSERGRAEAAALARRAAWFGTVSAVVSSPLRRARETAEAIAAALGSTVTLNDDLVEADFGGWEGLTYDEVRSAFPSELSAWQAAPDAAPPGGESFTAVGRRVRRGRDAIIAAHPAQTIVVVTHVTPIKTLLRLALDAPPASVFRIHLDTGSLSCIDYFADGACLVRLVNDTGQLDTRSR